MNAEYEMRRGDGLGGDAAPADMVEGYLDCAAWSSTHPDTEEPLDSSGEYELSDEAKTRAASTCAAFYAEHRADIEAFCEAINADPGQVGHDLWLTRNGHGVGFWARGAGEVGERLSTAARALGESDLYPGDDGLLYLT